MLTELCQELRNWFDLDRMYGTFIIQGGSLSVDFLQTGQYYRIMGSIFNDGVHKYGDASDVLTDETFSGEVWALGIPKAVVELAADIAAWKAKYETANSQAMTPFGSESFGGYSYTKASTSAAQGSAASTPTGWKAAYASALNRWRKI